MKAELEPQDIQAIASAVAEMLKPVIAGKGKNESDDAIFDKKGLSSYMKISESTINKLVSNKQIAHFKIQSGQSGGVRFHKKDINRWIAKHTIPEIMPFAGKIRS